MQGGEGSGKCGVALSEVALPTPPADRGHSFLFQPAAHLLAGLHVKVIILDTRTHLRLLLPRARTPKQTVPALRLSALGCGAGAGASVASLAIRGASLAGPGDACPRPRRALGGAVGSGRGGGRAVLVLLWGRCSELAPAAEGSREGGGGRGVAYGMEVGSAHLARVTATPKTTAAKK